LNVVTQEKTCNWILQMGTIAALAMAPDQL
jgi:hypothetical protein